MIEVSADEQRVFAMEDRCRNREHHLTTLLAGFRRIRCYRDDLHYPRLLPKPDLTTADHHTLSVREKTLRILGQNRSLQGRCHDRPISPHKIGRSGNLATRIADRDLYRVANQRRKFGSVVSSYDGLKLFEKHLGSRCELDAPSVRDGAMATWIRGGVLRQARRCQ